MMDADNGQPAISLPREVLRWVQSLDLSYSVKNTRRDFCNGFLIAEIISRYYPLYVQMHSFDNTTRYAKKKDNWQQIQLILKSLHSRDTPVELSISNNEIEDLIRNNNSATLIFVKKLYTQLAQKPLPEVPKAAFKDRTAPPQWEGTFVLKDKELVKLTDHENDFFKEEGEKIEEKEKKPELSSRREEVRQDQSRSVRLPKGPQKPISSNIQVEAMAPLKVDVTLKQVTKNVVQLRAEKEGNAYMLKAGLPEGGFQQTSLPKKSPLVQGTLGKETKTLLESSHASRMLSSEVQGKETRRKSNYEIIFEILTYQILSDFSKELAIIKFDNDTLTAIISAIDRIDYRVAACLIQELLNKKEDIINNCLQSLNDGSFLYTNVEIVLRKLKTSVPCFEQYAELLAEIGKSFMEESQEDPFVVNFMKQFVDIHLRRLCDIIVADPSKAGIICRVVSAHCGDNINNRIQMLKTMKDYLAASPETLTYTFAKMLEQESSYNDVLLDIYMYYAISGLSSQSSIVRVSALRMLNIMVNYNHELAFNLVDKLIPLIKDEYWEVKIQLHILSCHLLKKLEAQQNALKDDLPSTSTKEKVQNERNIFKSKLDMLARIVDECVNQNSSLLVIRIAVYHVVPLLSSYKKYYEKLLLLLLALPMENVADIVDAKGEFMEEPETQYTYNNFAWMYPCKCKASDLDKIILMKALAKYVQETKPDNLDQKHYQILASCAKKEQYPSECEQWFKIFKMIHEYLFLALADSELCVTSLWLLNRFFLVPNYQEAMFTESRELLEKTLAYLYDNKKEVQPICKEKFVEYVKNIDETSMKTTKDFFMEVINEFKGKFPAEFEASNLSSLFA